MKLEVSLYDIILILAVFTSICSVLMTIFGIGLIESSLPSGSSIRETSWLDLINPLHDNFFIKILWRASSISSSFAIASTILSSLVLVLLILILREAVRIIRGA
ncbi:MAG: hypothetical protein QW734_05365 [Candidatus Bathyarchaeia archaeon]